MIKGVITQPNFIPWIGYFEQIHYADRFVFLDNVQYPRREWCNRNRIVKLGKVQWLTVPIIKAPINTFINQIEISYNEDWIDKHLSAMHNTYSKCEHFFSVCSIIENCLLKKHRLLVDLNIMLIKRICDYLEIKANFYRASENEYTLKKTELLVSICKTYFISHYYSSFGAKKYMEEQIALFDGIQVEYQDFKPIQYPQFQSVKFVGFMSILDLIFNCDKKQCMKVIEASASH